MPSPKDLIRSILDKSIDAQRKFAAADLAPVERAADAMSRALAAGRKIISFGNGGSASDAEHLASELVGRFETERRGLAAIALTAGSSLVTSIANDYGYERVFSRQIDALGAPGDVAVGISTSGKSANVEAALAAAKAGGLVTIALTGRDGGRMGATADIHVNVAETSTARVQEVHRTILHAICAVLDQRAASADKSGASGRPGRSE
jgi:D-sedoheptulose 7-phosphate isomerase